MGQVIFWDFDGTLVESPQLWSSAMYDAILLTSPESSPDFQLLQTQMRGIYSWSIPPIGNGRIFRESWWKNLLERAMDAAQKAGVSAESSRLAANALRDIVLCKERYHVYPDAISTLRQAQLLGWSNYILSNHVPELWDIVTALKLDSWFQGCITSGAVGFDKPQPEIFHKAMEVSGHPNRCWMVGDNPYADFNGASMVEMQCILVCRDRPASLPFEVGQLQDVLNLIKV